MLFRNGHTSIEKNTSKCQTRNSLVFMLWKKGGFPILKLLQIYVVIVYFFQGAKKLCPQCNMITSPADLRKIYL